MNSKSNFKMEKKVIYKALVSRWFGHLEKGIFIFFSNAIGKPVKGNKKI